MILTPMVNSIETKLLKGEIENKINSNFIELNLLSKFLYKLSNFSNILLLLIKAYIIYSLMGAFAGLISMLPNKNEGNFITLYIMLVTLQILLPFLDIYYGNYDELIRAFIIPYSIVLSILLILDLNINFQNLIILSILFLVYYLIIFPNFELRF
jgi:hypothetical protein